MVFHILDRQVSLITENPQLYTGGPSLYQLLLLKIKGFYGGIL